MSVNLPFTFLSILVVLFWFGCRQPGPCKDDTGRTDFPVTTPIWPRGTSTIIEGSPIPFATYPIPESLPGLFSASGPGVNPGRRYMGCIRGLLSYQNSLILEVLGFCENFSEYEETFGTPTSGRARIDNSCERNDQSLISLDNFGEEQFIACGDPVVKSSNASGNPGGGGNFDFYNANVYVTTRVYPAPYSGGSTYRVKMVASDQFPFLKERSDIFGNNCTHLPALEMITSFNTFVELSR